MPLDKQSSSIFCGVHVAVRIIQRVKVIVYVYSTWTLWKDGISLQGITNNVTSNAHKHIYGLQMQLFVCVKCWLHYLKILKCTVKMCYMLICVRKKFGMKWCKGEANPPNMSWDHRVGLELQFCSVLTSALYEGRLSKSHSGRFSPEKGTQYLLEEAGCASVLLCWEFWEEKFTFSHRGSKCSLSSK